MTVQPLRAALTGELLLPGSPGYDAARRPAIANFTDVRPLAVVRCATPDDVAAAIGFTGEHGLPVAVRAGGHSFTGHSSTTGVLIDLAPMNRIEVEDGRLRVGAGARLGQVYDELAAHGLTSRRAAAQPSASPGSPSAAGWGSWAACTG
jgi:FAD/FMN-containing dehydrogenase